METIFQRDNAVLSLHTENKVLFLHLIRNIDFENFKTAWNNLSSEIHQKKIQKVIIDLRYSEEINMEERAWLITKWLPEIQKNTGSDLKICFLSSNQLYSRLGNEFIVNAIRDKGIPQAELVFTMDKAIRWMN